MEAAKALQHLNLGQKNELSVDFTRACSRGKVWGLSSQEDQLSETCTCDSNSSRRKNQEAESWADEHDLHDGLGLLST